MTTSEERRNSEAVQHDYLETFGGIKGINFADPANCRDRLEQMAASLTCGDASGKKAVSDYLAALQQPGVTPAQLICETNKLADKLGLHSMDPNNPNFRELILMTMLKDGVADHFHQSRSGKSEIGHEVYGRVIEPLGDAVQNLFSPKSAPPPSGPK